MKAVDRGDRVIDVAIRPDDADPSEHRQRIGVEDGDDGVSGLNAVGGMPGPVGRPGFHDADELVLPWPSLDDVNPGDTGHFPH